MKRTLRGVAVLVVVGLLAGCAAQKAYRRAERNARRAKWDQAVLDYSRAVSLDPDNTRYSVALERAKLKASSEHFEKGKRYARAGQWELAITEFQQTLLLYPGNQHARTEMEHAHREMQRAQQGPSDIERLKAEARRRELGPPKLDPAGNIPILLNFRDVEVAKIFEALSKASQINFIFDDKTDLDKKMTIDIGSVTLEKALDILMLQTKNFYKVIDEHTLLIAPDNRQMRQSYEDQVIRTFYLSNADTKQVVTTLRSLLQSRQIAENADLNSVTIKDTPDKVAIAERILNANDKAKGEVLVDVELLEINRQVIQTLGIDLSSKVLSLTFRDGAESVPLNNLNILNQQGSWSIGVVPSVVLNFLKSDSDSRSVAKPQLRVSEGEKAEILIGDRVPIPTTSFNTSQTIGGNIVPVTSFTYQNVGITVQVEPRVHHNKEVTLNVSVEISQIASFVQASGGQQQPIIGTRNMQTVIRLRDGETNLLAGLIKEDDSEAMAGIPGLMNVPGLKRVLSNSDKRKTQTDIVLTLTPHIIRIPDITQEDLATLWVGTEDNMRLRGSAKNALGASPFGRPLDEAIAGAPSNGPPGNGERRGSVSRTLPAPDELPARGEARSEPSRGAGRGGSGNDNGNGPGARLQPDLPPPDRLPQDESDSGSDEPQRDEPAAASEATVRLVPTRPSYRVGEVVELQVVIEGASNVGSVPFHLRYDRGVVEYLEGDSHEGAFLRRDGSSTVFLARDRATGGEVVVGLSRMGGGAGAAGAGTLAVLRFQAINPGSCGFTFTAAGVRDPQAGPLPAAFIPAAVEITP